MNVSEEIKISQEKEGVYMSNMRAAIIDVVEGLKYTNQEDAIESIRLLKIAKRKDIFIITENAKKLASSIEEVEEEASVLMEERFAEDYYTRSCIDGLMGYAEMWKKEFNQMVHDFVDDSKVVDKIIDTINAINYDRQGNDRIFHILDMSAEIYSVYASSMAQEKCSCANGHGCSDIIYACC